MNSSAADAADVRVERSGDTVQTYARLGGLLALMSVVAGAVGEAYVPSQIIAANDAAATARNLAEKGSLVRLGFAAYLIEA